MTTNYEMWLVADGSSAKMQFPVHPEEIIVTRAGKNEAIDLAGSGETTIIQVTGADQVKFECFFPGSSFPGCQTSKLEKPSVYLTKLREFMDSDKPIRLVSTACNISGYFTIENLQYSEKGGDVGTIYYTVIFKAYTEAKSRSIKVKIQNQKASVKKTETRVDNTKTPKTYTVVPGDCLWLIAQKFYGNGNLWPKIYEANKSVIGGNQNLIYAGQVFTIPD